MKSLLSSSHDFLSKRFVYAFHFNPTLDIFNYKNLKLNCNIQSKHTSMEPFYVKFIGRTIKNSADNTLEYDFFFEVFIIDEYFLVIDNVLRLYKYPILNAS